MKKAINYGYIQQTPGRDIRMKKAFPEGYRYLFLPHESDNAFRNKNMYTTDLNAEMSLNMFLESPIDHLCAFIGYKGIGKSTVLKNYFCYSRFGCIFDLERLIIPVFDWEQYTVNDIYEAKLLFHSINKQIVKTCSIKTVSTQDADESPFAYEVRLTKEYLIESGIKDVLFLFDNVEQLPSNQETLQQLFKAYKYLSSPTQDDTPLPYRLKVLISSTPEKFVWAMENGDFGRYRHNDFVYIYKYNNINLHAYLSKKRRQPDSPIKNNPEWDVFLSAFGELSRKFNHKYDAIIRGVSNYSIPGSLDAYADILSNMRWIHPKSLESSFRIEDMTLNNITVLRALFCLENEMIPRIHTNRFCNFLYSNGETDNSMIVLLTIKLFYQQCCVNQKNHIYTSTNKKPIVENLYGEQWHLKKHEVLLIWKDIFGTIYENSSSAFEEQVSDSMDYLYEKGIIAKCCKANKGEIHGISDEARLYLTPKGQQLWEMLSQDSVLLELFREDYIRIYEQDTETHSHSQYSSQAHISNDDQFGLFVDLCILIMDLAKTETRFREIAVNRRTYTAYKNAFGEDSVASHLYAGVSKSIHYSGANTTEGDLKDRITDLCNVLETLSAIFRWV